MRGVASTPLIQMHAVVTRIVETVEEEVAPLEELSRRRLVRLIRQEVETLYEPIRKRERYWQNRARAGV